MVVGATKLTADSWSSVVDDVYNKPSKKRPYYYIHNQNDIHVEQDSDENILSDKNSELPTNIALTSAAWNGNNATDNLHTLTSDGGTTNFPRTFDGYNTSDNIENNLIEKPAGSRHANSSKVKIEIRCGQDKSNVFSLSAVQIDYVKAPQFIRLTQEQLDSDEDISQVMEFPDYVNQEIINELVNLVMRKTNDPSLQAHL